MKISNKISWLELNKKLYLKNIYTNSLLILSGNGINIWHDIEKGLSLNDIVGKYISINICSDPEIIEDDINALVNKLETKGYVLTNENNKTA